jgi:elongation factor Tu
MDRVTAEHADRGQVIVHPGTIQAHAQFEAIVYWLSPDEGGRLTPVADGYRPYLTMRTAMATASFTFPDGPSGLHPGASAAARVELLTPVAMAPGLRFAVREGGRTVGIGIVTRVF